MRSLLEKKPLVLLLSILALGALVVLSVSLRSVPFGDAQPIGREEAEQAEIASEFALGEPSEKSLQSQVVLIVAFVVLVALVGVLLSPEGRKKLFIFLIRMIFTVWVLFFLFNRYPGVFDFLNPVLREGVQMAQETETGASLPPPVFTPPQETPMLSYVVSLLIVLGVVFVAWWVYRAWQAMNQHSVRPLHDLARIARSSLRDLSDGHEITNVIMNCYFRMGNVVADRKNLQRGLDMTPSEFAFRMEEAGLPGDAVHRLTRLFEGVRYGDRKAGPKDVNEAVACLTTILQYCEEPV